MNNFKRHHNDHKKPKPGSIDGFVTRTVPSADKPDLHKKFRTSYQPVDSIDNIESGEEGFTSNQQAASFLDKPPTSNQIGDFDSTFTAPLLIEDTKKPRRNIFKRNKNKHKKPVGRLKKTLRAFAVLSIALILGIASLFGYGYIKTRQIFKGDGEGAAGLQKNVDPARLNGEGDGRVNILLIGKGGPGHEAPDLTDTLLLASIDPIQNEAALVSVPRDLYVKDVRGYSTKINAIYSNAKQARLAKGNSSDADTEAGEVAGLSAIKDSISSVLGIPVHYYIMVDFTAFEDAINTVSGITVDVKEPLYDQSMAWLLGGNPLIAGKGLQTFDGKRALLYARSRHGSSRGDFDRTERQRQIIVALQSKILSLGTFSNPFKVADLLTTFGNHVRTDLNGLDEIKRLYEIGQNIGADRIASVGLADPPNMLVRTNFIDNQSVVVPIEGTYEYSNIQSYIRNTLRDAFLKSEDARVIILNGSGTAGVASARSNELKSYGYNIIGVGNAPTADYTATILIDNTNSVKRYTRSYLEKRLGVEVSSTTDGLPTIEEADFVIILGTDEANKAQN